MFWSGSGAPTLVVLLVGEAEAMLRAWCCDDMVGIPWVLFELATTKPGVSGRQTGEASKGMTFLSIS